MISESEAENEHLDFRENSLPISHNFVNAVFSSIYALPYKDSTTEDGTFAAGLSAYFSSNGSRTIAWNDRK